MPSEQGVVIRTKAVFVAVHLPHPAVAYMRMLIAPHFVAMECTCEEVFL